MTGILSFLILMACAVGLFIWLGVRRGNELLRLGRTGLPTTGRLSAKRERTRKGRTTYTLVYEYRSNKGQHQRSMKVSRSEFDAAREDTEVDMVYLPDNPRIAATRAHLGQAISAAHAGNTRRRWDD